MQFMQPHCRKCLRRKWTLYKINKYYFITTYVVALNRSKEYGLIVLNVLNYRNYPRFIMFTLRDFSDVLPKTNKNQILGPIKYYIKLTNIKN